MRVWYARIIYNQVLPTALSAEKKDGRRGAARCSALRAAPLMRRPDGPSFDSAERTRRRRKLVELQGHYVSELEEPEESGPELVEPEVSCSAASLAAASSAALRD